MAKKYLIKRSFEIPEYNEHYEGYYVSHYVSSTDLDMAKRFSRLGAALEIKRLVRMGVEKDSLEMIPESWCVGRETLMR